ncbi:ferrochelatase [Permianibacter sp. IMCC34836]|uniref:ferrochelatase n=1 Tax=Permianibacter fluminis TaxID=2738515 RepID=UPI00155285C5|nr:ferrochelatase [Permianibacter fluminis]NQD38117.1 ferrochelatase [Permianibacter fluminis]
MTDSVVASTDPTKGANSAPFGLLLVNLGSPDEPTTGAVRRYLKEFLSDPRVVDAPRWLWWLILNGVILNIRSSKVAKLYQSVWQDDSPLRAISRRQAGALQTELRALLGRDIPVAVGMTYGNPSLKAGLLKLRQAGVSRVLVLPMYPQFSGATTGAVFDGVASALKPCRHLPELRMVKDYHDHPGYIAALADSIRAHWQQHGRGQTLVFSYHGLPQRFVKLGDPYAAQCERTTQAVVAALQLKAGEWQHCYQSRFGREPWLQPYLDQWLDEQGKTGLKSVDVICPGFAADCLETLEEIAERGKHAFLEAGGERLHYIPALNDNPEHIRFLAQLVQEQATAGWIG